MASLHFAKQILKVKRLHETWAGIMKSGAPNNLVVTGTCYQLFGNTNDKKRHGYFFCEFDDQNFTVVFCGVSHWDVAH
jgi:hypothetical protein